MCWLKPARDLKLALQILHTRVSSKRATDLPSCTTAIWLFSLILWENFFSHIWHSNGFSPVWVLRWTVNVFLSLNSREHTEHLWALKLGSWLVYTCLSRPFLWEKAELHFVHWNPFGLECWRRCLSSVSFLLNADSQCKHLNDLIAECISRCLLKSLGVLKVLLQVPAHHPVKDLKGSFRYPRAREGVYAQVGLPA